MSGTGDGGGSVDSVVGGSVDRILGGDVGGDFDSISGGNFDNTVGSNVDYIVRGNIVDILRLHAAASPLAPPQPRVLLIVLVPPRIPPHPPRSQLDGHASQSAGQSDECQSPSAPFASDWQGSARGQQEEPRR